MAEKRKRIKVDLGRMDGFLRKYAADRNISINSAICIAVAQMLTNPNK